jgi:anti-sigma regulatory factor (Ser/Thr protein kinase)
MEQPVPERPSVASEGSPAAARRHPLGSLRLDLRRDAQAPAAARTAVGAWCPDLDGGAPRLETLLLLVSEVVTNAVIHSRGPADAPILLTASVSGGNVQVAVVDAGEGFTPPARRSPRASDRITIGGYGLYVLDRGASRWGVDREGGTRVWFEL